MTFLEVIATAVKSFLDAYGLSIALMVIVGLIIAFIVELAVKNAFDWLEKQTGINVKVLKISRISVIFLITMGLTIASTVIILKGGVPLPGNSALAPIWFMLIYICQYVFSMFGIKNILGIKDKKKEPTTDKEKKDPLAGLQQVSKKVWTDGNGNYYNKRGKQI